MCKIHPSVDLEARTLTVSAPGMPDLVLPLSWGIRRSTASIDSAKSKSSRSGGMSTGGENFNGAAADGSEGANMIVRVCGNRRTGVPCTESASAWFTRFLGVPCSLVRATSVAASPGAVTSNGSKQARRSQQNTGEGQETAVAASTPGNSVDRAFANEAQYLLISQASVAKVNEMIRESYFGAETEGSFHDGIDDEKAPQKVRSWFNPVRCVCA